MSARVPDDHWLDKPENIRRLWLIFIGVLVVTVLAEGLVHLHPVFAIERWFGFNAAFGFAACVVMIVVSKILARVLKRPDTFYAKDDGDE